MDAHDQRIRNAEIKRRPVGEFVIFGNPAPAGSKRAVPHASTGKVVTMHANKRTAPWMRQVKQVVGAGYDGSLLDGPVILEMDFFRARPKSHFGTGRNAAKIKPSAPLYPTSAPDALKLGRAIEDALKGIVYRDDALVIAPIARKWYGTPERAEVRIWVPEVATWEEFEDTAQTALDVAA